MRRDPPQFAEEVEDKATLSSFFSGLPGGGSDEGSNHPVDESGCGFYQTIRMSFTALEPRSKAPMIASGGIAANTGGSTVNLRDPGGFFVQMSSKDGR